MTNRSELVGYMVPNSESFLDCYGISPLVDEIPIYFDYVINSPFITVKGRKLTITIGDRNSTCDTFPRIYDRLSDDRIGMLIPAGL